MLKIIGGEYRHRQLLSPKGDKTRPTAAIVRAAAFNMCQQEIEGAHFLDLCAGSGAIGLEALSRGAVEAYFVEFDLHALRCIMANIEAFKVEASTTVTQADAVAVVTSLSQKGKRFNIIYVDPPYAACHLWQGERIPLSSALLYTLDSSELLVDGGWLFIETAVPAPAWLSLYRLQMHASRRYGSTMLHIFKK